MEDDTVEGTDVFQLRRSDKTLRYLFRERCLKWSGWNHVPDPAPNQRSSKIGRING
jgi:hypothetical protein